MSANVYRTVAAKAWVARSAAKPTPEEVAASLGVK